MRGFHRFCRQRLFRTVGIRRGMAQQTERHARGLCHCGILDTGNGIGHHIHIPVSRICTRPLRLPVREYPDYYVWRHRLLGGLAALLILFFSFFLHPIIYVAFDREFARSQGIPVQTFEYVLMMFIALTIVACLRMVGIVLVISLLTIPQMTANLFRIGFTASSGCLWASVTSVAGRAAHFILSQCSFGSSHHLLLHYYLCNL